METFNKIIDFALGHKENLATVVVFLVTLWQAVKARLQMREAMVLLVNTLKDEGKMTPEGAFKSQTIEKIEKVAEIAKVGKTAIEEVKKTIDDVNRGGLKIGSYKGKPIYLEDVSRIGASLAAFFQILRGIFRK